MFAYIRGRLLRARADQVVVETQGVGYLVSVPPGTLERLGDPGREVELHLHTHVREDQLALYGFSTPGELEFFQNLIQVDQVGPRLALAILGSASLEVLRRAILDGDAGVIRRAPGVGARTAQKVIIDLRPKLTGEQAEVPATSGGEVAHQVELSLRSLGFPPAQAKRGLAAVDWDGQPDAEDALAQAIRALGR